MTTREWSVEKSSVDLRDLQATTMALSKADEGQVYGIEFIMVTISFLMFHMYRDFLIRVFHLFSIADGTFRWKKMACHGRPI